MRGRSWADRADRVLQRVFTELPKDATDEQIRAAVRDAYPFGARECWPYKVWLARVGAWRHARSLGIAQPIGRRGPARNTRTHTDDGATLDMFGVADRPFALTARGGAV